MDGEMLDWNFDQGLKLGNIRIKKTLWLRRYIEFSIRKRKEAKAGGDKIDSTFFILMNNAFYVKTIENVYK